MKGGAPFGELKRCDSGSQSGGRDGEEEDTFGVARGPLKNNGGKMVADKQAREVLQAYLEGWQRKDKESWLALFAADAEVIDPVGAPAHTGLEAISAFWDTVTSTGLALNPTLHRIAVCGDEAVMSFTMASTAPSGMGMAVEIIDVFTFDDGGKISRLRAYWDQGCMRMITP